MEGGRWKEKSGTPRAQHCTNLHKSALRNTPYVRKYNLFLFFSFLFFFRTGVTEKIPQLLPRAPALVPRVSQRVSGTKLSVPLRKAITRSVDW